MMVNSNIKHTALHNGRTVRHGPIHCINSNLKAKMISCLFCRFDPFSCSSEIAVATTDYIATDIGTGTFVISDTRDAKFGPGSLARP